jgi:serine/threonine-protein kinase
MYAVEWWLHTLRKHRVQPTGRIELSDLIHLGTTSAVYRGTCEGVCGFSRPVAIKVLRSRVQRVATCAQAFFAEARCAARVRHPCVVDVHAFVESDTGAALVMQLVEGWTLQTILSTASIRRRTIPLDVVAAIGLGAAESVGAVHRAGLVHRDVAPENLLVTRAGHVVLIDFGSAFVTGSSDAVPAANIASPYSAPELIAGVPGDRTADVFSLGAILRAMLDAPEPADEQRRIPPRLDDVVSRAMAFDRALRPVHALELADSLERALPMPWRGCVGVFLDELFEPAATPAPVPVRDMPHFEPIHDTRIRLLRA